MFIILLTGKRKDPKPIVASYMSAKSGVPLVLVIGSLTVRLNFTQMTEN